MDQHLACPYCNQTLAVSDDLAGQTAQCPYCNDEFIVPGRAAPRAPQAPPAAVLNRGAAGPRGFQRAPKRSSSGGGMRWAVAGAAAVCAAVIPLGLFALFQSFKRTEPVLPPPPPAVAAQGEAAPSAQAGATAAPPTGGAVLSGNVVAPPTSVSIGPAAMPPGVSMPPAPVVSSTNSFDPARGLPGDPANPFTPVSPELMRPNPSTIPPPSTAPNSPAAPPNSPASPPSPESPRVAGATKDVVQTVEPSVVVIEVPGVGLGSGFVIDDQGTIATNYHVIEGAKTATATFLTDKSTFNVQGFLVVAPGKDLAILKIEPNGRVLRPLPLSPGRPEKGETVLAFGAPKGFGGSVSDGIISAIRSGTDIRELLMGGSKRDIYTELLGYDQDAIWLQTTAPISGGNSGGPLVNLKGEVVGLNTWNRTDGQNLNFAISAEHIRKVMQSAQSGLRPLSDLPKPRKEGGVMAMGDGKRTLAYWNQIGDINRTMVDRLKKAPRPPLPTTPKKSRNYFTKLSNFYRKWAEILPESAGQLKDLDVKDVDQELVVLVAADAMVMESIADDLRQLAFAAEAGRARVFETDSIMKKSYGGNQTIGQTYDILRLKFNLQYGMTFPNISGDSPRTKPAEKSPTASADDEGDASADAPPPKAEDPEKAATRSLALAKQLLKNPITRDAGREKLQKIIADFPGTKAAAEAKKLLGKEGTAHANPKR